MESTEWVTSATLAKKKTPAPLGFLAPKGVFPVLGIDSSRAVQNGNPKSKKYKHVHDLRMDRRDGKCYVGDMFQVGGNR